MRLLKLRHVTGGETQTKTYLDGIVPNRENSFHEK